MATRTKSTTGGSKSEKGKVNFGRIYFGLIDILYAIVLTQGFISFSSKGSNYGLLYWISSYDVTALEDMIAVYVIVIGSWIRFHFSYKKDKLQNEGSFIVNIVLMIGYYFAFVQIQNPVILSVDFCLIFFFYIVWWITTYGKRIQEEPRREEFQRDIIFVFMFGLIPFLYFYPPDVLNIELIPTALLVLVVIHIAVWRVQPKYDMPVKTVKSRKPNYIGFVEEV